MCKSSHYAIYLILTQCRMSIISQQTWTKKEAHGLLGVAVTWVWIQINAVFCDLMINQYARYHGWTREGGQLCLGAGQVPRMAFREVHENTFTVPSPIHGHTYSWFLFWEPERTKTNILHLCLRTLHTLHNFYEFYPSNFPGPYLVLLEVMEMWPRSLKGQVYLLLAA